MACNHKFQHQLELQDLDFEPTTLIVGSFNPAWPANNTADWFYGRTDENCFWEVLPRLYGEASLIDATTEARKQFCKDNKIAFTDLISAIGDAEPDNPEHVKMIGGFSDKAIAYNFEDFDFVNIVGILKSNPGIRNVYITRGVTEAFWRHLWNPVAHYCSVNKLHERKLLTPDGSADYHHKAYNTQHPENAIPLLEDYILMRWRQEWHF